MPLIGVGIAIIADIGVGAAGFGAVLAGTASLATTFAAVGAVGATISAIGAVTGVKGLQTAGLVLGGIGGVGALAGAVGAFGDGATLNSVFGSGGAGEANGGGDFIGTGANSSIINGDAGAAASGAVDAEGNPLSSLSGTTTSSDVIANMNATAGLDPEGNPLSSYASATPTAADPLSSGVTTPGDIGNGIKGDTLVPTNNATGAPTTESPSGSPTDRASIDAAGATKAAASSIPKIDQNWLNDQFPNPMDGTTAKAASGASYTYSTADGWAPKSSGGIGGFLGSTGGGLLGMGVVQAAGSFLSGAFDPLKPAQVAAYQAQANANNAAAALTTKQTANMGQPIPVAARRLAVTGKPGLIDSMGAAP